MIVVYRFHIHNNLYNNHRLEKVKICDAFGAMGHFCMDNIRQGKRLPDKIVIEVEVR
jgi:hypothetical protein